MSKQSNRTLWVILLLCGCTLLLAGCRLGRRATPTPLAMTNLPPSLQGTPVAAHQATAIVQTGAVIQRETYTGRVVAAHQEDLFFRRSGRVAKVYVKDGDKVKSGDVIAVLDEDTLELDLESAQLGVQIAQQSLDQAKTDLIYHRRQAELNVAIAKLRMPSVTGSNNISNTTSATLASIAQNQLTLAQLTLDNIEATIDPTLALNLKRAQLGVDKIKQTILDGQIKAPFDGEVRFIDLPKDDEQVAAAAYAAVARVVDSAKFQIELNLPRAQLEPLREGMPVEISAASLAGATIKGTITALPRPFGTSSGSLVEVGLVNAEDNVRFNENTSVAVSAALQSRQNALIIPRSALRQKDQLYYVLAQDGDKQRQINVAVGIVGEDQVEVIAGVNAGQTVVLGGN